MRFTDTNRVPFPFQKLVREKLNVATLALTSEGPNITVGLYKKDQSLSGYGSTAFNVCSPNVPLHLSRRESS